MQAAQAIPADNRLWHLPVDASLHGPALDAHLLLNLWVALGLLALAHLLLFTGVALRRRGARLGRSRMLLEYLPLTALTLLFAGLGVRAERLWAAQRYTGADLSAMQVEVTGMQFVWYFRYPGQDATFGHTSLTTQLVLPADREVDITLHAQDVIHGFSVPALRIKQNATPGQTAHIHFTPTLPGDYAILCTQVCGLGHYRMTATLRVLPPAAFDQWLHTREVRALALANAEGRP
jgi:cytochrome c oxidase subunit 2